jgi:hypothetical protein
MHCSNMYMYTVLPLLKMPHISCHEIFLYIFIVPVLQYFLLCLIFQVSSDFHGIQLLFTCDLECEIRTAAPF